MGTQTIDFAALLANLEAKKQALEAAIGSLRAALAMGALGGTGETFDVSSPMGASGGYGNEVPAGAFLGKSIPEAARIYLEIVKKKQTSREIAEALLKGGMESTSSNFFGIVHAVLDRARKAPNPSIVKLGTQWGLSGWYPKGILNSAANNTGGSKKKGKKAKKAKRVLASNDEKPILSLPPGPAEAGHQSGAQERIAEVLKAKPESEYSAETLAEKLGQHVQVTRMILGKLTKAGVAHKTETGAYRAAI